MCRRVDETLSSLVTISLRYRGQQSINPDFPIKPTHTDDYDLNAHIWTWKMDGNKRRQFREAFTEGVAKPIPAIYRTYDGQRTFEALYPQHDPARPSKLFINSPGVDILLHGFTPDTFMGIPLNWTEESILSKLAGNNARVIGWEDVMGHPCVHVHLGTCTAYWGDPIPVEAWLDPAHDWLPRQITYRHYPPPVEDFVIRQIVTQFKRVPDPLLGRDRWFPQTVDFKDRLIHRFEMLEITVNEPIAAHEFVIRPESGMEVTEWRDGVPVRASIFGGPEELEKRRQEIAQQAATMPPPSGARADATPPDARGGEQLFAWLVGVFLCVCAIIVWRRQ